MGTEDPGTGTPSEVRVADLRRAWFVWRHWNARQAEDPRACFYAGVRTAFEIALDEIRAIEATLREHTAQLRHAESLGGQGKAAWDVIAATVVWSGLVAREERLLELLESWRVDRELMRAALEEAEPTPTPEEVA